MKGYMKLEYMGNHYSYPVSGTEKDFKFDYPSIYADNNRKAVLNAIEITDIKDGYAVIKGKAIPFILEWLKEKDIS